jgi:uncharacterized membrane protein
MSITRSPPSYLRRLVAMQAVISFPFNTMVLALAINLAANLTWVRVCAAGAMQHR